MIFRTGKAVDGDLQSELHGHLLRWRPPASAAHLLGALTAYQRATELQPRNARALYGLGIVYDRLARPEDAALMYRKAREVARH